MNGLELAQAANGWPVFPCRADKTPMTPDGFKSATTDPELIRAWWSRWPDALVGVAVPEGITVIDLDRHDGRDGVELAERNGWPVSADVQGTSTSGNGMHLFYFGDASNSAVVPGYIDRRAGGRGYVVTPYRLPPVETVTEPLPEPYCSVRSAPVEADPEALRWLSDGEPSGYVTNWIQSLPTELRGDDAVPPLTADLADMTYAGYSGTRAAFEALEAAWSRAEHSSPNDDWPARSMSYMLTANRPPWIDDWSAEVLAEIETLPQTETAPRRMLKVATLDDLATRPAPEELLEGLIQGGRVTMLYGPSQVGKSFMALGWSAAIATGTGWHGHRARSGRVLYIGAEGADAFPRRMAAWEHAEGLTIPRDRMLFADEPMSLAAADTVEWTKAAVDAYGIDLIVMDTYSQLSGVDNENDNAENARALAVARAIRSSGNASTAVLFIHHPTKDGSTFRGSTALFNNVDTVIVAKGDSSGFMLSTHAGDGGKLKDGNPIRESGYALAESPIGSAVVVKTGSDPVVQTVLDLLADGEAHPAAELTDALVARGISDARRKRRLAELVELGTIVREGSTRSTTYRLPF